MKQHGIAAARMNLPEGIQVSSRLLRGLIVVALTLYFFLGVGQAAAQEAIGTVSRIQGGREWNARQCHTAARRERVGLSQRDGFDRRWDAA